jgi:transposase InsO family protein
MYEDVVKYVKSCEECQRRSRVRQEEPLHPTWSLTVWEKVGIDVVYMPWTAKEGGMGFIVFARDDLSGWVEGRAIKAADAKNVSKFIYEDVICRHGCPRRVVLDRGSENLNLTKGLLEHYRIQRTVVSAYHPQSNGLVERGHDSIVNSLSKYCSKRPEEWAQYLPLALWADRVSVRRSTGYSAFELVYGRDCLLPVDFTLESWSVVD